MGSRHRVGHAKPRCLQARGTLHSRKHLSRSQADRPRSHPSHRRRARLARDRDIVDQIGEGGIEVRSQCSLDIVLAFHHLGLRENLAPAAKVVQTDIDEGWVDKPVRHLPFVPCRILPRNVVFQERTRLVASTDGSPPSIELYPKPRVTIDSSHGGTNAVNAGVPDVERFVQLPSVQQHARGLAIVDTASADDSHAYSYVVDAESAYRYCPVQEADLCA